jgi:C4-type Zn-finger protein
MNKEIMKAAGFGPEVEAVERGECPFCGKTILVQVEFRNPLSKKEYGISGLCQTCQDKTFGR